MHLLAIGGSDAGISAALRARELDPDVDVTVLLADAYPNYSICGIPYYLSGEVPGWQELAHRTRAELEAAGIRLLTDTTATAIDVAGHRVTTADRVARAGAVRYDRLVVGTGAVPVRPPIDGLDRLGPADGVHLLHSIGDARAVMGTVAARRPASAVVVGAGYIGLEMAEALTTRGIAVTQLERLPQVLPTVDAQLAALVAARLRAHGVDVRTATRVVAVEAEDRRVLVRAVDLATDEPADHPADLVVVVTGVTPDTALATAAGAAVGAGGAIRVDRCLRTGLPDVFAAGDCAVTYHPLLGETYLPLGTTAHKQGRLAGENALGGDRKFAGSVGTQVVKVFDLVAARTGLRDREAAAAGYRPATAASSADDHKAYYPGSRTVHVRLTGDAVTGQLLGAQMAGPIPTAVHKRIDTAATALFAGLTVEQLNDLDLSYTPPLGSPWDVLQAAAQHWGRSRPAGEPGS